MKFSPVGSTNNDCHDILAPAKHLMLHDNEGCYNCHTTATCKNMLVVLPSVENALLNDATGT